MGMTEWGYVEAGTLGFYNEKRNEGVTNVPYFPGYIRETLEELLDMLDGRGVVLREDLSDLKLEGVA